MRVSVIATVKNEERSIRELLTSLMAQTRRPDEIVLVDGGSTDGTVEAIREFIVQGFPITVVVRPGVNISEGRNIAIAASTGEIIASTDAGVRLESTWLEELVKPFERAEGTDESVDVVSGFFLPDPRSVFETAMGATVLPALQDIDPATFLPSSRSVAYRKTAWESVGGYPEHLDYCEDLVFDLDLKKQGLRFHFAPEARVYFRPRSDFASFFKQYYRYARGDGKAHLWTKRHLIRYTTYGVGCIALVAGFWYKIVWLALALAAAGYVYQPYRRLWPFLRGHGTRDRAVAIALVPAIRLVGDVAKMIGYPIGLVWRYRRDRRHAGPVHSHR